MATEITYIDAIREAQAHALRDDPRVFIYGQDVAAFGGAFKATKNLAKEFPGRVFDAPISEDAMVGMAVGAAIEGLRPIIEMQFADFSTVGFQSNCQPGGDAFLAHRSSVSDHRAAAFRRHLRRRAVPQPEFGDDLRALSRPHRADAGDG